MDKPTVDLTSQSAVSPQTQLDTVLEQVDPQQKQEILNILGGKTPSWGDLINDYGKPTPEEDKDMPTSSDIDTIYRSIFKDKNMDAIANPFLRIEELYDAIMKEMPGSYDNAGTKHSGLFTNISENTMAAIYETIYNKPMNYADYETYLAHGTPNYYTPSEEQSLTNDDDESNQNYNFNQDNLTPAMLSKIVVHNDADDDNFREENGISGEDSQDVTLTPYQSGQSLNCAYLTIHNLLGLPIQDNLQIPIEAAVYFTTLKVNDQKFIQLPKFAKGKITKKHYHHLFKLSNLAPVILSKVIGQSDTLYNQMPVNSLITYLVEAHLNYYHQAIFTLCKKTLLELYSLCYAIKYPDKYLDYLTVNDLKDIKKDLHFIKEWSSHFMKYRPLIEVWDNLETAVGYVYPYFKEILNSTDLHYTNQEFNDNSIIRR